MFALNIRSEIPSLTDWLTSDPPGAPHSTMRHKIDKNLNWSPSSPGWAGGRWDGNWAGIKHKDFILSGVECPVSTVQ